MHDKKQYLFLWACWCLVAFPVAAIAQDESLDAELFEDLAGDLLDDLPAESSQDSGDDALEKHLGQTAGEDIGEKSDQNPLIGIAEKMRKVETRLARRQASEPTQQLQQQIVKDLSELIAQARKSQQKSSSSSSSSPGSRRSGVSDGQEQRQPGTTSQRPVREASDEIREGEQRELDLGDAKEMLKDLWGHLPERDREQMLQWSSEEFQPKYDEEIRQYFLRLAQEAAED